MTRPVTAVAASLLLMALVGCGVGQPTPATHGALSASAPNPDRYADEAVYGPTVELPSGLLLKEVGKVAEYGTPWAVRVVVEGIDVDPECDEHMPAPERGHRVVLTLDVRTSADFDPAAMPPPSWHQWSSISPEGVGEATSSVYNPCHPLVQLPDQFRPQAHYRAELDIDTANPAGRVVLGDLFAWDY